jgi:hypothetical protein
MFGLFRLFLFCFSLIETSANEIAAYPKQGWDAFVVPQYKIYQNSEHSPE